MGSDASLIDDRSVADLDTPTTDSDDASNKNSDSDCNDSTNAIQPNHKFFQVENKFKRIFKFSIQEWRSMISDLTGKRLSFKSKFSDNLSLRLQETGKYCFSIL
jgi:hypothetical protein